MPRHRRRVVTRTRPCSAATASRRANGSVSRQAGRVRWRCRRPAPAMASNVCAGRLWQSMQSIIAALALRELLRGGAVDDVFRHVAVAIGELHPRNRLALAIGGDVLDRLLEVHVPVDAAAGRGLAAADVQLQRRHRLGARSRRRRTRGSDLQACRRASSRPSGSWQQVSRAGRIDRTGAGTGVGTLLVMTCHNCRVPASFASTCASAPDRRGTTRRRPSRARRPDTPSIPAPSSCGRSCRRTPPTPCDAPRRRPPARR